MSERALDRVPFVLLLEVGVAKVNPIQLQKSLKGVKYPASKQDLLKASKDNQAADNVRAAIANLPDTRFQRPSDVSKAIREQE